MSRRAAILVLLLLLAPPAARAAETVFSCDVVQDQSDARYPEVIALDRDRGVITHLKREWLDSRPSSIIPGEEQFVDIAHDHLTWGRRRASDRVIEDRFTLDLQTGQYAWLDGRGQQLAHGACGLPDLAS